MSMSAGSLEVSGHDEIRWQMSCRNWTVFHFTIYRENLLLILFYFASVFSFDLEETFETHMNHIWICIIFPWNSILRDSCLCGNRIDLAVNELWPSTCNFDKLHFLCACTSHSIMLPLPELVGYFLLESHIKVYMRRTFGAERHFGFEFECPNCIH